MLQDDCLILYSVGPTPILAHPLAHHLDHTPLTLRHILYVISNFFMVSKDDISTLKLFLVQYIYVFKYLHIF
jgi:hypothetical protein